MSELSQWLLEIADAANEALGFPCCNQPCEHGGRCTLDTGHEGDHIAQGAGYSELCRWSDE